jgi:hypothetical protein
MIESLTAGTSADREPARERGTSAPTSRIPQTPKVAADCASDPPALLFQSQEGSAQGRTLACCCPHAAKLVKSRNLRIVSSHARIWFQLRAAATLLTNLVG